MPLVASTSVASPAAAHSGSGRLALSLRWGRRLAWSFLAGVVLLELTLRLLLFGGGVFARVGEPLRRPALYADPSTDELYTSLTLAFDGGPGLARVPESFDPVLGWGNEKFDPETLRHVHEGMLDGHRPVLLYGDSFAACSRQRENCWEIQLAGSDLSERFGLLNYGVSGYGLDQIWLLLERTLPQYAERNPLVLVGVFVDDDLDRVGQRLTTLPKPWFELDQGELVLHPPLASSRLGFLEAAPPRATSYVWRRLLRAGLLPEAWSASLSGAEQHNARTAELSRVLIARIHAELESLGLEHAFVLFHGRAALSVDSFGWQEPLLRWEFERLGARYVDTRTEFREDMQRTGRVVEDYFRERGKLSFHYSTLGQEVAFGAFRRALAGEFEPSPAQLAAR